MGEVYRAEDTRLDRSVAIKTVRGAFTDRFQREAKAIAALNHPHICTLYDVGPDYLVMEYIEGKPLEGPLPIDVAMRYARQIAEALDAAHRRGLVHRDLKPANVLITKAGAKLLDFGLAKSTAKPTIGDATQTVALTGDHAISGTIPYMSPEQLEGKEADERSDIFAFGCVLYEMLTGRRAFQGESQASLITSIMSQQPPSLVALVPSVPPGLDRLIRRAMAKDPDERWQSAGDLREALDLVETPPPVASAPARVRRWPLIWAGVATAAALGLGYIVLRPVATPPAQEIRLQITPPPEATRVTRAAISPDGKLLAVQTFVGTVPKVWLRPLDSFDGRMLRTEGVLACWFPDSKSVVMQTGDRLVRVDVADGSILSGVKGSGLVSARQDVNSDGVYLTRNPADGSIVRVSLTRGEMTPLTKVDTAIHTQHESPQFFPDGRRFTYRAIGRQPQDTELRIGAIDRDATSPPLAAAKTGSRIGPIAFGNPSYMFHTRAPGVLLAQRIDPESLRQDGDPITVESDIGAGGYMLSRTGIISYSTSGVQTSVLAWYGRDGKQIQDIGDARIYSAVRASPDGRLAMIQTGLFQTQVWLMDLTSANVTAIPSPIGSVHAPLFSGDGKWIYYAVAAFGTGSTGGVMLEHAILRRSVQGGAAERMPVRVRDPIDLSSDGQFLLGTDVGHSSSRAAPTEFDIVPLVDKSDPAASSNAKTNGSNPRFSPDSRWIAYSTSDGGRDQVYVRDFTRTPGPARKTVQISNEGGSRPQWRADGRELVYQNGTKVMAVPVTPSGEEFRAGPPKVLFELPAGTDATLYGVAPDGNRLLLTYRSLAGQAVPPINVIVNWQSGLKDAH
jgi:eukaryotic-like serine/threonine-protein kinase